MVTQPPLSPPTLLEPLFSRPILSSPVVTLHLAPFTACEAEQLQWHVFGVSYKLLGLVFSSA